jgi:hypothetical protein
MMLARLPRAAPPAAPPAAAAGARARVAARAARKETTETLTGVVFKPFDEAQVQLRETASVGELNDPHFSFSRAHFDKTAEAALNEQIKCVSASSGHWGAGAAPPGRGARHHAAAAAPVAPGRSAR